MSGAKVALASIPGKGIAVDGVVAVFPRDSLIVRTNVADGKSVLKGQAVMFSTSAKNTAETSVNADTRVFMGIADSSGTKDSTLYQNLIPIISVLRGPVGRGVTGADLAASTYAKAGADGLFYPEAVPANAHARIRDIAKVATTLAGGGPFPTGEPFGQLTAVDLEFWTVGK